MDDSASFGAWIQRRRKALDLTQDELAQRVACSYETIRKIEADARRPSKQIAARLADQLRLAPDERAAFLQAARAEVGVDRLAPATRTVPQSAFGPPDGWPHGNVTFLFTDIEGSTQLWAQQPQAMGAALARYTAILRAAISAAGGVVFKMVGDAVYAAFASALDGVTAALVAQRALGAEAWGVTGSLRVRMALHTGVVAAQAGDYVGLPVSQVARLLSAGHGGQVLLSQVTQELLRDQLPTDTALHDLGTHRLKDLTRPTAIFQLVAPNLPADFPPLRIVDSRCTNLPAQPTALIGREREIVAVRDLLPRADVRLVTLTGPGGVGKTRLALQVAAAMLDDFADGVYFVNLAPIGDPALVAITIAQVLGVPERGGRPLLDSLQDYLHEKQLLLLLDNFEQVLDAAPLVAALLAAPGLKVLVTSRATLHLSGEHEYGVPPLALPGRTRTPPLALLTQYEAVRLFIERTRTVKTDFALTAANAAAVAEICHRLDGLPLAIELAAARSKLFAPHALLARLEDRLALLTGGARDLPTRQQTIRATLDWSYNLLDVGEQTLFARLGVFVGGWTLEAAEAMCGSWESEVRSWGDGATDPPTNSQLPTLVLDGLVALLDQSLLRQVEGLNGEPRFTMLETTREYALERLAEHVRAEALRLRHAEYFLALAEAAEPELRGPRQSAWLERLEQEHDNLRAALAWGQETASGGEIGVRLAGALFWFWYVRGYWSEGRRSLENVLVRTEVLEPTQARAKALYGTAALARSQGDSTAAYTMLSASASIFRNLGDKRGLAAALLDLGYVVWCSGDDKQARALYEESVAIFRELGDRWGLGEALGTLGILMAEEGDLAAARSLCEESLVLYQELDDRAGIAGARGGLGEVARLHGDFKQAQALYEEGVAIFRELGYRDGLAGSLDSLGCVLLSQGDYRQAKACFAESLALRWELGHQTAIVQCLGGLAGVAQGVGQPERAARLFGAAEALRHASGARLSPADRADYDHNLASARAQLDEAIFAAAWAAGRAMTLEQAIRFALA